MVIRSLAPALAAALLAACAAGPDYVRPDLPVPARFARASFVLVQFLSTLKERHMNEFTYYLLLRCLTASAAFLALFGAIAYATR